MVNINEIGWPKPHFLVARKDIKEMKQGDMKEVYVQKMDGGRYSVMGLFMVKLDKNWQIDKEQSKIDYFYAVFNSIEELHQTFNEQLSIEVS